MTAFGDGAVGDAVNIETERSTQGLVDTVATGSKSGPGRFCLGWLEALLRERRLGTDGLIVPSRLPCS